MGNANNGDFWKMAGPFALGPEVGSWQSQVHGGEFVYKFIRADRYRANAGLWTADFLSSEFFLVDLSRGVQRLLHPGPKFDIRWLGFMQGAVYLLAIGFWIYSQDARHRVYSGWLIVLILTDSAYVQYFNSFYQDAAAIIFLVFCAGTGVCAVRNPDRRLYAVLTVCSAALFAASKTQHAVSAFVFIPLFLYLAIRNPKKSIRGIWIAGSLLPVPLPYRLRRAG